MAEDPGDKEDEVLEKSSKDNKCFLIWEGI
jgi:hypothetical protein